jgi:hypothetical protein
VAWYDDVNAVWRQVGSEVGAEFEFHDRDQAFEAALVRRTGRWTIALEYRAEVDASPALAGLDFHYGTTTRMKALANTATTFEFKITRALGQNYDVETNDGDKYNALIDNEEITELLSEVLRTLGRSSLVLYQSQLSFEEGSSDKAQGSLMVIPGERNWMLPISDPSRLKALFRLFEAVLESLEQPEVQNPLTLGKRLLKEECAALRNLGIGVRTLELDQLSSEPAGLRKVILR